MQAKRRSPIDAEVGRRVRLLRLDRKVSQSELSQRLGLTFQQVQKYEKGTNRIAAGRLQEIADFFNVPVSYFFEQPRQLSSEAQTAFAFLETAHAFRLLKAFSKIKDDEQRMALVKLAESMMSSRKLAQ